MEKGTKFNYEETKNDLEKTLNDVLRCDTLKDQKENFRQLDITVKMMHDIFGILTRGQVVELREMIAEAKKKKK